MKPSDVAGSVQLRHEVRGGGELRIHTLIGTIMHWLFDRGRLAGFRVR